MLTNLDWIGTGKPFPPKAELPRLARYRENELLFDGDHQKVFGGDFQRIEAELKKRHMNPGTVVNYPQLLTKKTADFVCGEPPEITVGEQRSDALNDALDAMNFDTLLYETIMDVSRFGDAPIKIMNDRVSQVAPDCWFPVVDPTDLKFITHHVIAFPTEPDNEGKFTKIYVEIHGNGTVETRMYVADTGADQRMAFGALIPGEGKDEAPTGLNDFGVKVLRNVSHSKSIYGMDDYNIVKTLVKGIMWRLHCIDLVLDKHSEPSLSGPANALSYDKATGLYYLDLGNYFKRDDKDAPTVDYLTWDGNLDAAFQEVKLLVDQLYVLSEMGAAFMEGGGQGAANSGTALKLRLVSPRVKTQRIAGTNTQTVKQLIAMIAQIKKVPGVKAKDVSINWNDGIPDDRKELAELLTTANGGKPIESQLSTIKVWNTVDDEGAEKIMAQIELEQAADTALVPDVHAFGGVTNDAGGTAGGAVPPSAGGPGAGD